MNAPPFGWPKRRYHDRVAAGRKLAIALERFRGTEAIVVALPRGGVPIAFEIANTLQLPLDILLVRKLGVPGQSELAMGAIATGGVIVLNERLIGAVGIEAEVIQAVVDRATTELNRREHVYRDGRPALQVRGRTIVLIDDGVATGSTLFAAIQALRERGAANIVVAVPVASPEIVRRLEEEVDEVVCPYQPSGLLAVGQAYDDFGQVTDDEVRALLARGVLEQIAGAHDVGVEEARRT